MQGQKQPQVFLSQSCHGFLWYQLSRQLKKKPKKQKPSTGPVGARHVRVCHHEGGPAVAVLGVSVAPGWCVSSCQQSCSTCHTSVLSLETS